MAERVQTYQSHTRLLPAFHFFVLPVLLLNVFVVSWRLVQTPTISSAFAVVFAVALLMLALLSRSQAITVQDRLIRLEMRLRLRQLLPADLQPRINALTHRQLVALRFASDEEMPELVGEILGGKLHTGKEIKQRVKNWQADWLRA
jgi:uncharacterized protein DUF6526